MAPRTRNRDCFPRRGSRLRRIAVTSTMYVLDASCLPDHSPDLRDGLLRGVGRPLAGRLHAFFVPSFPRCCLRERTRCLQVGVACGFSRVILGATCGYVIATLCGILGGNYFATILSPKVISIAGRHFSFLSRRRHSLPSLCSPNCHFQGLSCLFTNTTTKQTLTPALRPSPGNPHRERQTQSCRSPP